MIVEGMWIFAKKQNTVDDGLNIGENENGEQKQTTTKNCIRFFLAQVFITYLFNLYIAFC